MFGPRQSPHSQYAAVIPKFITAALKDEPLSVFGDGEQSRDFTYIDNVVQANLLAMESPHAVGKVYNVACGGRYTLNELHPPSWRRSLGASWKCSICLPARVM